MTDGAIVRILSHQACTGGTIISRVMASAENIALLSEISPAGHPAGGYQPLTPLVQMAAAYPSLVPDVVLRRRFVIWQLRQCLSLANASGCCLVLRDHAHVETMESPAITLDALARRIGRVLCVVTVRHPAASYLSLTKNFPDVAKRTDFATYCERYSAYLDRCSGAPIFRYETFCVSPMTVAADILRALDVALDRPLDKDGWKSVTLSGNSGRAQKAGNIRPMPFHVDGVTMMEEAAATASQYGPLCKRLGYDPDVSAYARTLEREAQAAIAGDFRVEEGRPTLKRTARTGGP